MPICRRLNPDAKDDRGLAPERWSWRLASTAVEKDPLKGIADNHGRFRAASARIARHRPADGLIVQAGRYLSDVIGDNRTAVLAGLRSR